VNWDSHFVVYRRFRDKDALMAAVFQRLRERSSAATAQQVDREMVRPIGLVQFSRNIIEGMIQNHRRDAGLSRAAIQYSEHTGRRNSYAKPGRLRRSHFGPWWTPL
jgi:AcrR family transcriptional regulator